MSSKTLLAPVLVAALALAGSAAAQTPAARAASGAAQLVGVDSARLAEIDQIVAAGIADGRMPGAVVVVGRGDAVLFEKAYGQRAVVWPSG
jgi:hypothetical protein